MGDNKEWQGSERRKSIPIDETLRETVKEAVKEVFKSGTMVSPETHEDHHRWVCTAIKKQEKCIENRQRITTHVIGWLAVGALSLIFSSIYFTYIVEAAK